MFKPCPPLQPRNFPFLTLEKRLGICVWRRGTIFSEMTPEHYCPGDTRRSSGRGPKRGLSECRIHTEDWDSPPAITPSNCLLPSALRKLAAQLSHWWTDIGHFLGNPNNLRKTFKKCLHQNSWGRSFYSVAHSSQSFLGAEIPINTFS